MRGDFYLFRKSPKPLNFLIAQNSMHLENLILPKFISTQLTTLSRERIKPGQKLIRVMQRGGRQLTVLKNFNLAFSIPKTQFLFNVFKLIKLPLFVWQWERINRKIRKNLKTKNRYMYKWIFLPPFKRLSWILFKIGRRVVAYNRRTFAARIRVLLTKLFFNKIKYFFRDFHMCSLKRLFKKRKTHFLRFFRTEYVMPPKKKIFQKRKKG